MSCQTSTSASSTCILTYCTLLLLLVVERLLLVVEYQRCTERHDNKGCNGIGRSNVLPFDGRMPIGYMPRTRDIHAHEWQMMSWSSQMCQLFVYLISSQCCTRAWSMYACCCWWSRRHVGSLDTSHSIGLMCHCSGGESCSASSSSRHGKGHSVNFEVFWRDTRVVPSFPTPQWYAGVSSACQASSNQLEKTVSRRD